jgi:hypothetical protein
MILPRPGARAVERLAMTMLRPFLRFKTAARSARLPASWQGPSLEKSSGS